ncbi:WXG100 family type VII secretion target [Streptomyces sp. H27-D2]|uniref:WXG100 family type VII secretion target n=1 Tax=Streptomyces sp. H27-D2 TaxID=3046304 RepID=UPI002DBD7D84|nr:WXG100 family type VII secretion target [Streptomyces sp. H27-D2]MEC4020547.1 WXG100 family type VII secretion target [Streptomyces sp. H27-D2]
MTDDDGISVDFGSLKQLSGDIEDILNNLTTKLDALYARVEKVTLTWEGEARDMCVESLDKWDRSVQDLEGAQRWLHEIVVTGHINYDAAHKAVLRSWGGS